MSFSNIVKSQSFFNDLGLNSRSFHLVDMIKEIFDKSFKCILEIVVVSASADIFLEDRIVQSIDFDLFECLKLELKIS